MNGEPPPPPTFGWPLGASMIRWAVEAPPPAASCWCMLNDEDVAAEVEWLDEDADGMDAEADGWCWCA